MDGAEADHHHLDHPATGLPVQLPAQCTPPQESESGLCLVHLVYAAREEGGMEQV